MQGRNILDGVVILHEAVHELHSKKLNGVILKLDFKKAYDKFNVPFCMVFLQNDVLRSMIACLEIVLRLDSMMTLAATSRQEKVCAKTILYHQCYLT
jgi:hypothetical protein